MSEPQDDAVEALLRAHFEGPVPDAGFSADIMHRLPPRRRRHMWPLAVGLVTGAAVCWLSLQSVPLVRVGWRDWLSGQLSAPALTLLLVMASLSLLTLAWTIAEADDRRGESRR
jgi:hypothetical protein